MITLTMYLDRYNIRPSERFQTFLIGAILDTILLTIIINI